MKLMILSIALMVGQAHAKILTENLRKQVAEQVFDVLSEEGTDDVFVRYFEHDEVQMRVITESAESVTIETTGILETIDGEFGDPVSEIDIECHTIVFGGIAMDTTCH